MELFLEVLFACFNHSESLRHSKGIFCARLPSQNKRKNLYQRKTSFRYWWKILGKHFLSRNYNYSCNVCYLMPVLCWKLGGNGFEYWSKWLFTSCKLNKFKKVNIYFSSQPYVGWERNKRREMKVMLSVWQPHGGTGCSSASPWLPEQALLHSHSGKTEEWVSVRQHMLSKGLKGSGSVECRVLGVCARIRGQPLLSPSAAGSSQEQGLAPDCSFPALCLPSNQQISLNFHLGLSFSSLFSPSCCG